MITDVDYKNRVWQSSHVLYAADVFFELFNLALEHQLFFFRQGVQAGFLLDLHVFQTLDRRFDRFEVGQHAAQPTLVHKRDTRTLGFSGDDFAGLALGTDHQNSAAVSRQLLGKLGSLLEHR